MTCKSNKLHVFNSALPAQISNIAFWHDDRNLIDGSTDEAQTYKLFEEFIELVAADFPTLSPEGIFTVVVKMLDKLYSTDRIKTVEFKDVDQAKKDALGDMIVVQTNIAERNNWLLTECVDAAWQDIKDRKGSMQNGIFVKEDT